MDHPVAHIEHGRHAHATGETYSASMHRLAALTGAFFTLTTAAAMAAEPARVGPAVTVTASRDATTPSEAAYVESARKKLQAASRDPSGREASLERPGGTAAVWADVARDGRIKGRGVERSSGSPLLDGMARSLIGRSRFPAIAAGDFGGGSSQRFAVSDRFDSVAMTAGGASKVAWQQE